MGSLVSSNSILQMGAVNSERERDSASQSPQSAGALWASENSERALTGHSGPRRPGLPPPPLLCKQGQNSQDQKHLLAQVHGVGGGHFPRTDWAWCHVCAPGQQHLLGAGGGRTPQTRLPLIGQGGSGRKTDQGNASSWTGRTGFRTARPATQKEAGSAWVPFPKPGAPRGGRECTTQGEGRPLA